MKYCPKRLLFRPQIAQMDADFVVTGTVRMYLSVFDYYVERG